MTTTDRILLLVWVPLWALTFLEGIRHFDAPMGISPLEVASAPGPDAFPMITGQRDWTAGVVEEIRPGDELLRLAEHDLEGAHALDVFLHFASAARGQEHVPITYRRKGRISAAVAPANPASFFQVWFFVSLIYMAVAVLLIWRAPSSPMVRTFFQAFAATAILFASPPDDLFSLVTGGVALGVSCSFTLMAFQLFPDGDAPRRWLWRTLPWAFLILAPLHTSRFGAPFSPRIAEPLAVAGVFSMLAAVAAVATRNYRLTDVIGRRQLRWVLFGIYLAVLPPMLSAVLIAIDPSWTMNYASNLSASAIVPLGILISVIRYNLFDIDRLISAAASYNLLLLLAAAAGFAVLPDVGDFLANRLSLDPRLGRTGIAILLAAGLFPAHRVLRPSIERIFFRERWNLDQGIEGLIGRLHSCRNVSEMTSLVGDGLVKLLRPEVCVVYARRNDSFTPVFVRGHAVPPGDAEGSLVQMLENLRVPIDYEAEQRRHSGPRDAFDRARLETLRPVLVIPVHTQRLLAFICLGRKRSGDVYTPTDRALLAWLTDHLSNHLLGRDPRALGYERVAMEEKLRRYVPGAIVEELARGGELGEGEREISVLFVDIRGYTSLTQDQRAEQIFSTVNRYTQTVSRVILKHGGTVVEFNGDGMMAVFGAPRKHDEKERSAVKAAREIVRALAEDDGELAGVAAGVGIASGTAYTGNIRSADRMIWSCVGNTTNLAARLQDLTRTWDDVAVVIDARTYDAAGEVAAEFELRGPTEIRGRRQRETVYALPS